MKSAIVAATAVIATLVIVGAFYIGYREGRNRGYDEGQTATQGQLREVAYSSVELGWRCRGADMSLDQAEAEIDHAIAKLAEGVD